MSSAASSSSSSRAANPPSFTRRYRRSYGRYYRRRYSMPRLLPSSSRTSVRRPETVARASAYMSVKRTNDEGLIGTGTSNGRCFVFRLDLLPSYTEFTNLFDEYKLNMVVVHFIPQYTMVNPEVGGAAVDTGMLYYAADYDDGSTPTSKDYMLQMENCRYLTVTQAAHVAIRPKSSIVVDANGGTYVGASIGPTWINCGSGIYNHYGLKVWCQGSTTTTIYQWRVLVDYYITFRKAR